MTTSEIANKAAELVRDCEYSAKDKKKVRVWNSRVYCRKGYLSIRQDGSIDLSPVEGIAYTKAVATALRDGGFEIPTIKLAGGVEI